MTLVRRLRRLLADPGPGPYQCSGCGARYAYNRQLCPDCGSFCIERVSYEELL